MGKVNIGFAKACISNTLKEEFLLTNTLNESKKLSSDFFKLLESSPFLQLEFNVYKNLENKTISNDVLATRYIDNNISQFSKYSKNDLIREHAKINKFCKDNDDLTTAQANLYEAIDDLISETVKNDENGVPNIDTIHESFSTILDHIKSTKSNTSKKSELIESNSYDINEVLKIAINKFNQRYSSLDEDEKKITKVLALGNMEEKKNIFESLKNDNLEILNSIESSGIENKIEETTKKLNKMSFNDESSIKDVINLYELKKSLT